MNRAVLATAVVLAGISTQAMAAAPSAEQMWALIQQQQAEIDALKRRLAAADTRIEETVVKVEATADALEQAPTERTLASGTADWTRSTRFGAYGEMHYNNLDNDRDGGSDKDEIDFHRMVLFLGHDFSERTRFFAELELEHSIAGEGQEGEYELEQAYVEHLLGGTQRLKAGLFLMPVGILNETHEPDTFYGVERNNVESSIVPSTWWEGGAALAGEIAPGVSYDLAYTSGLGLDPTKGQWKVRDGRQKVSEADASDAATTGRLKYTGVPGLEIAATAQYQSDLYQGEAGADVDAWLLETHVAWQQGPFGLRALYAGWDIDEAIEQFAAGADRQEGWYVEPSWRIDPKWGVFTRYSEWDNQAGGGGDTAYSQWDVGVNYWLEESVVFKLDYQKQDAPEGKDQLDGINLGVGMSF
jgi:phosphate-selective porin